MHDETLLAIETLVHSNCLTLADALEMAYKAGHRKACKELDKGELLVINGGAKQNNVITSTNGDSP